MWFESITHSILHPRFLPYLPGRQEKSRPGPPTLPVNTTTLLRAAQPQLAAQLPRPQASSSRPRETQAHRDSSGQGHASSQGECKSIRSDLPAKTVTVTRPKHHPEETSVPLLFPSLHLRAWLLRSRCEPHVHQEGKSLGSKERQPQLLLNRTTFAQLGNNELGYKPTLLIPGLRELH